MKNKVKNGLASRRIAGEMFVVDSRRAELHELNGSAALIWEGLAAGRSEAAIVSSLAEEFEVSEKQARADMADFLKALAAAGLLE